MPSDRSAPAPGSSRDDSPLDHPGLRSILPLLYQAWSDGVLTPEELRELRRQLQDDAAGREVLQELAPWLDPEHPPTPERLATLRAMVAEGEFSSSTPASRRFSEAVGIPEREAARSMGSVTAPAPWPSRPPRVERPAEEEALARYMGGRNHDLRQEVLALLQTQDFVFPDDLEMGAYRERVLTAVRRLADAGLGRTAYPAEWGGGGSPEQAIATFETLAFGDLSVVTKFGVQFGLFGGSILQLGTRRHHEAYLGRIGSLELPGCYAMTEVDHGSNVRDLETEARFDPASGEFVVRTPHPGARKDWIGNAALHGRMATVFARLRVGGEDHGVHAFLVPLRDREGRPLHGIEIEDCGRKVGLNGVDNGRIAFHDVRIPRENLLDRFAEVTPEGRYESPIPGTARRFFTMLGTLVTGRISVAAASISVAKTALTIAVRYGDARRQFGPAGGPEVPILDYLAHQRLLLPPLATTYGLHFAVRKLARAHGEVVARSDGDPQPAPVTRDPDTLDARELEAVAAGLKAEASWNAMTVVQAARESLGGRGYLAENRLGRLRADADIFTTFEGANVVLLQLVAKSLLTSYREDMGDLRFWGVVRYLAERAGTRITERNPLITRRTDAEHLRDPDFHRSVFRYREDRLLASVARRLRALIDQGEDSFRAMNLCQDHLVSLARAHIERRILEAFQEGVARAPAPGISEPLRSLCQLYALSRLEAHLGWHLEAGSVEAAKARAIRREVNVLCEELRDEAVFLVNGFGIPDGVLRAPDGMLRSDEVTH